MIRPQSIRFIVPPSKTIRLIIPSQQSFATGTNQLKIYQKSPPSFVSNGISTLPVTPSSHSIVASSPSSENESRNLETLAKLHESTVDALNVSSSSKAMPLSKNYSTSTSPKTFCLQLPSSTPIAKRRRSSSNEMEERNTQKPVTKNNKIESKDASINTSSTSTTVSVNKTETTTSTTTLKTSESTLPSCPGGHVNPPTCTTCSINYENKDSKCVEIKATTQPASRSAGRRSVLIFLICFLTVIGIVAILVIFRRSNQYRRRRSGLTTENLSNSAVFTTNMDNRFSRVLRSFGWNNPNRRGPFNFFSISNNNQSSGQYRSPQAASADLHENLDEALLFDDPYADSGLHNSSANPYKSLTLAIT